MFTLCVDYCSENIMLILFNKPSIWCDGVTLDYLKYVQNYAVLSGKCFDVWDVNTFTHSTSDFEKNKNKKPILNQRDCTETYW
jgi:hypothetical protein